MVALLRERKADVIFLPKSANTMFAVAAVAAYKISTKSKISTLAF